ncbi:shikimate dehydrogenase [Neosynechococcus sphagnicola sy1]|uniref:Shikimate dehydrogenase (NADP(+)) n=1 Tax=Neosynechococcus sphagnicola sy1 TaxID=1497020 RepID=A0A098TML1_9CYAN|nr:shikimate dehydrogenase [Neosynechococcus sphagnicola]KGF73082.1 shikimate dehydrogenase [Neosynechococcus sphagnicola sy1]
MITGQTKLLGVIGDPIGHSLSPVMHNAALAAMGLDYAYLPFPIRAADLRVAIAGLAVIGVQGFSVTIPHKQAIVPLLTEVSETARAIGAVNMVQWTDQGWVGTNTDMAGFLAPLRAYPWDWSQRVAVILGNGGAARAVVAGCAQLGCRSIWVVGRDPQKLEALRQSWDNTALATPIQTCLWADFPPLIPQANLLVNTTPIGMYPQVQASPVTETALADLRPGAIAYDLIYTPRPTRFLELAQQRGAIALDGLEMLVQQGAIALESWLGQPVPIAVMRQALERHLKTVG